MCTEWKWDCRYACEFSFLLWVDCSTNVGQFIILYSETITGNLLNKRQRHECLDKNSNNLYVVILCVCLCVYLGEQCEQVFMVGYFQMFGVKTMQSGNINLSHLPFLIIYIFHVCYRKKEKCIWLIKCVFHNLYLARAACKLLCVWCLF